MSVSQNGDALRDQVDSNKAPVLLADTPADKTCVFGVLDEPCDSVVPFLQKFSEFRDGCPTAARKPSNAEEQLVLLLSNAFGMRSSFTETSELPNLVLEVRELTKARKTQFWKLGRESHVLDRVVSRRDALTFLHGAVEFGFLQTGLLTRAAILGEYRKVHPSETGI